MREDELPPCSAHMCEPMPPSLEVPVGPMDIIQPIEMEDEDNDIIDESGLPWC